MKNKLNIVFGISLFIIIVLATLFVSNPSVFQGRLSNQIIEQNNLQIQKTASQSTSITLTIQNANLSPNQKYNGYCLNNENANDFESALLDQPAQPDNNQIELNILKLKPDTTYQCFVGVATLSEDFGYSIMRRSKEIKVKTASQANQI